MVFIMVLVIKLNGNKLFMYNELYDFSFYFQQINKI